MRDCRGNEENWAGAVRTGDFLNWNGKPDLSDEGTRGTSCLF